MNCFLDVISSLLFHQFSVNVNNTTYQRGVFVLHFSTSTKCLAVTVLLCRPVIKRDVAEVISTVSSAADVMLAFRG